MKNYFRITAYNREEDYSIIIDSNSAYSLALCPQPTIIAVTCSFKKLLLPNYLFSLIFLPSSFNISTCGAGILPK